MIESTDQLRAWRDRCEQIAHEQESHLGGLGGWAYRLGEDLSYLIGELGEEPTEPHNQESTPLCAVNSASPSPPLRSGPAGDSASLACDQEVVGSGGTSDVPSHQRNRRRKPAPPRGPEPSKRTLDFVAERERVGLSVEDMAALVNLSPAAVLELDAGRGRWSEPQRTKVRQEIARRAARRDPEC